MGNRFQDIVKIENEVKKGAISPVYFFYGDEPYFIEKMSKLIIDTVINEETKDFNRDILSGEETTGDDIVSIASSFPMMAEKRVILVKNIQKLSNSGKKKIEQYIDNPNESSVLILNAGKINIKTSFYQKLKKKCSSFESPQLYENEARAWVIKRFKKESKTISTEGASFIVQLTGTSQWALSNEIEKILLFTGNLEKIGVNEIAGVVGHSRNYNVWELTESVFNKKIDKSIEIFNHIIKNNNSSAVGLIANLSERAFVLLKIRSLKEKGANNQTISKSIPMWPFLMKRCFVQASSFTKNNLIKIIDTLLKADIALKTGRYDKQTIIILAINGIIRGEDVPL
ncbi:DNA polymerase III subunit delta [bacterium]|nr:DNA polymerase III subunit delta [bacterium]